MDCWTIFFRLLLFLFYLFLFISKNLFFLNFFIFRFDVICSAKFDDKLKRKKKNSFINKFHFFYRKFHMNFLYYSSLLYIHPNSINIYWINTSSSLHQRKFALEFEWRIKKTNEIKFNKWFLNAESSPSSFFLYFFFLLYYAVCYVPNRCSIYIPNVIVLHIYTKLCI